MHKYLTTVEGNLAELRLAEYPWQGVKLPRDCICSNLSERLIFQSLSSAVLELSFTVNRMNVTQDYLDFFFEGEYRFIPSVVPVSPSVSNVEAAAAAAAGESLGDASSLDKQHQTQQSQQHTQQGSASSVAPACHGSSHSLSDSSRLSRLEERRLRGTSGEISLRSPPQTAATSSNQAQNTVTMRLNNCNNEAF